MVCFQCSLVLCLSVYILDCYGLNCRIKTAQRKENELMKIYSSCANKRGRTNIDENSRSYSEEFRPTIHRDDGKNSQDWVKRVKEYESAAKKSRHGARVAVVAKTEKNDYDYTTDEDAEVDDENEREDGGKDLGDAKQSDDYNQEMVQYDSYRPSKRSNRHNYRKKIKYKSGQRSQNNPNIKRRHNYDDEFEKDDDDDEEYSSKRKDKTSHNEQDDACTLHCFMETLKMTDNTGFPNKYLVTQAIIKDIVDVELKVFLQESSEECFDILNASKNEKCEFSKNLLACLSDKGKNSCDDWKNDTVVSIPKGYSNVW